MKKQVIAIIVAAVLALLAVVALVVYANNADDRALEGTETVEVLQATEDIPVKTPASELAGKVELVKIPKSVQVPGALASLDDLEGQVTAVAMVAGDQLSEAKFDDPESVKGPAALPDGMQELTIQIDGARFVGGAVKVGDRVGVFTSYQAGQVTSNPINQLLVLRVDTGVAGSEAATGTLVTVAVDTLQAQQIVNASEFGTIWMTLQNDTTDVNGPGTINQTGVAP
ncbi:Flp pilus assembly protein CpaB [Aeromicrobium sp.]|uniref:Flp pilus assembly protein CpaB n=1 Tax=Aeromicrobium sp. TaxID=1871063 RepID=UPI0025C6E02C|nr:Flp pilus assembly protein CpaB [Aeromicrobium sp.]MCK5890072.1 Flp pilus assembly protein CpaB [Aeromicrobium sp.]